MSASLTNISIVISSILTGCHANFFGLELKHFLCLSEGDRKFDTHLELCILCKTKLNKKNGGSSVGGKG